VTIYEKGVNNLREMWCAILVHASIFFLLYAFLISGLDLNFPLQQDVTLYYEYSKIIVQGKRPYIDFEFEYPPLALIPMMLPHLFTTGKLLNYPTYLHVFAGQNCLYSVLVMLLLATIARRTQPQRAIRPILLTYMLIMIVLSPFLFWRFDIFPAALSIFCLYAVLGNRPKLAGIMAGLGIAAKLYAVAFLPVMFAYYAARREWLNMVFFFCASAAAVGLIILPFLIMKPNALLTLFFYHQERGLQLESVTAGVVIMLDALGFVNATVNYNHGAWHVATPMAADNFLTYLTILCALVLGAVALCCYMRFNKNTHFHDDGSPWELNAYFAMALMVLLVFSNVFSPQFLIWLIPFAVLLPRRQALLLMGISLITLGLVTPWIYPPLIERQLFAVLLLNLRNMLFILLFLLLMKSVGSKWELSALRRGLKKTAIRKNRSHSNRL
jgi:uncharacterized membrane protein